MMATFSDDTTDLEGTIEFIEKSPDGPHMLLKFATQAIKVVPSPVETYEGYRWFVKVFDALKRRNKRTAGK